MKFSTAFKKISKLKGRIRIAQGAGYSSKTYSICQIIIILCIKSSKPLTVSIVSESMPHLRRGAMKDFLDILIDEGLYIDSEHNKSNNTYKLKGCKVEFFGANEPDKLRGGKRDILFLNECNNVSHEAFMQLRRSTRKTIYLDYNPSHLAWIREYIKDDKSNIVKINYKDNEFIDKGVLEDYAEQITKAKKGDKNAIRFVAVYVNGEEGSIEGAIYEYESINTLPDTAEYLGTGLDFGWTDPNAAVKVWRDGEKDIILQQYLYKSNLINSQLAMEMGKDIQIAKNIIVADSARPEVIAEMRNRGLIIKAIKKPNILDRIVLAQNYNLKVLKGSTELEQELNTYIWDTNNENQTIQAPKANQKDHLCDAFSYLIWDRLAASNNHYCTMRLIA